MRSGQEVAVVHCQGLKSRIGVNWQYQPLAQATPLPEVGTPLRAFPSAKHERGGCSLPHLS